MCRCVRSICSLSNNLSEMYVKQNCWKTIVCKAVIYVHMYKLSGIQRNSSKARRAQTRTSLKKGAQLRPNTEIGCCDIPNGWLLFFFRRRPLYFWAKIRILWSIRSSYFVNCITINLTLEKINFLLNINGIAICTKCFFLLRTKFIQQRIAGFAV